MAIEGFEDLDSTKVGRVAERICRANRIHFSSWKVLKDLDLKYDTSRDMDFELNGKILKVEFKGDNYPRGNNLAFEIKQESMKGMMVPSGIATSSASEWDIYCFRTDTIYTFDIPRIDDIVYNNTVREYHYKLCNLNSSTGKTLCIVIDIDLLLAEGFFKSVHKNVLSSLDKLGVSRHDLGIEGLEK